MDTSLLLRIRRILLGKVCKKPKEHRLYHALGEDCECIKALNNTGTNSTGPK